MSSRIAVVMRSAWAMGVSVAWVRAGGEVAALSPACILCTRKMMTKQEKSVHKKRGRPAGRSYSETIPVRLSPALKSKVEAWARRQPDEPSRSEALRRLVETALKLKGA
jgi:hypothetical protein